MDAQGCSGRCHAPRTSPTVLTLGAITPGSKSGLNEEEGKTTASLKPAGSCRNAADLRRRTERLAIKPERLHITRDEQLQSALQTRTGMFLCSTYEVVSSTYKPASRYPPDKTGRGQIVRML